MGWRLRSGHETGRGSSAAPDAAGRPDCGSLFAASSPALRFRRQRPSGPSRLGFLLRQRPSWPSRSMASVTAEDRPRRDERRDAHGSRGGIRTLQTAAVAVRDDLDGGRALDPGRGRNGTLGRRELAPPPLRGPPPQGGERGSALASPPEGGAGPKRTGVGCRLAAALRYPSPRGRASALRRPPRQQHRGEQARARPARRHRRSGEVLLIAAGEVGTQGLHQPPAINFHVAGRTRCRDRRRGG